MPTHKVRRPQLPQLSRERLERLSVRASMRAVSLLSGISIAHLHQIEVGKSRPSPQIEARRIEAINQLRRTL
jgi:hypothetical protein